jgi:PAS domain-containing protein
MGFLDPLSSQWQVAFLVLCLVMGSLLWRGHRQTSQLATIATSMAGQLELLTRSVATIEGRTSNTENTLVANLSEYRMAMRGTSQYREYLQKLGVAPGSDIEPILEAIPDAATGVGKDGSIFYANRNLLEATGIEPGMSIFEIGQRFAPRTLAGDPLRVDQLPESAALRGDDVREFLVRLRPPRLDKDVILSVNGSPVRDVTGRVVAAVMVSRVISEEIALAMQVRQLSGVGRAAAPAPS